MTHKESIALMNKMHEEEIETATQKGREYSGNNDRLDNFKRLAEELNLTPEMILWVYLKKHIDAVCSYVQRGKTLSTESIESRIMDCRIYLCLLRGLIAETRENEKLTEKCRPYHADVTNSAIANIIYKKL